VGVRLAFDRLVHSDWSVSPKKRWSATALRSSKGWSIVCLQKAPDGFVDYLLNHPGSTLAGFDFPIGLPSFYVKQTSFGFRSLISDPSSNRAQCFLSPTETLFEISTDQPFYRKHPQGGSHSILFERLRCRSIDDLLRQCDRKTKNRSRAETIFWTVGAKQVGKAALAGWREILIPCRAQGASLWPFDGPLSSLQTSKLTIAETYPAEAYQHIGMPRTVKKRSQAGRQVAGKIMLDWAAKYNVSFTKAIEMDILDGLGSGKEGEDPFDALAGLCGIIEVVDGRRAEAPTLKESVRLEEGWILGQVDTPC
jgi:hypothetical protein